MEVDPAYARATLGALMVRQDAAVWITKAGFLAASIERSIANPAPVACEHGWYAEDGKGLPLLRAFEAWAAIYGATVRLSTGAVGPDLARLGYTMVEKVWVK